MSGIEVQSGGMYDDGRNTVNNAFELRAKINELYSCVNTLLSGWSGPAASSFEQSYYGSDGRDGQSNDVDQNLNKSLNRFVDLLEELGINVSDAAVELDNSEQQRAADLSNLIPNG